MPRRHPVSDTFLWILSLWILALIVCNVVTEAQVASEESAARFWITSYREQASVQQNRYMKASWDYSTNLTEYNKNKSVMASLEYKTFQKSAAQNASKFKWETFNDSMLRREFHKITDIGTSAMNDSDKLKQISNVEADMEEIYSTAKVCDIPGHGCIDMDSGLEEILRTSRDYGELLAVWKGWRDNTGRKMKDKYETFVRLKNEAIRATGVYSDLGKWWKSWYEDAEFEETLEGLLSDLQPLYEELHTYVRDKLQRHYSGHKFPASGHIPAHLLGNMWGQVWNNIMDIVKPYNTTSGLDVTPQLKAQNYSVLRMYQTAEAFFVSLGLPNMTKAFWRNSMLKRPSDGRKVTCHASAWDFYDGNDFRIKMCTNINMDHLVTVHHEMGHIMYYQLYKDQPITFREGANPGFHEAIGDLMALSVVTPAHLKAINLLPSVQQNKDNDINYLMSVALSKIAFLPFGYLIDQWRWSVFRGETPKDKYNDKWWQLRCKYQGISPPIPRTEEDFDPGAKYHIPGNTPYIRYFVSYVIQFQFHQALCEAAGHKGPLHQCDIYQSKEAGNKLRKALSLGSSKPWPDVMFELTGQRNISVEPLKNYFKPLLVWLREENKGKRKGWSNGCPSPRTGLVADEAVAKSWLETYETEAQMAFYRSVEADWKYNTNITDVNQAQSVNVSLELSKFQKEKAEEAETFNWRDFKDQNLTRQFRKITDVGTSALKDVKKLAKLRQVGAEMEGIYSKGSVCLSTGRCLQIEPGLTRLMATSDNYTLLAEAWKGWRDATGKKMIDDYEQLVDLSNQAVSYLRYNDTGEYWRSLYETPTFQRDLENLLQQLAPLYENLHAYVRRKLIEKFGSQHFPGSGHIPAHLLGNMWGQQWNNINELVQPYPKKRSIDVTPKIRRLGWNATKLFRVAEEFFTSLGLKQMPDNFWKNSMIVKPKDGRDVVCHASAWDFYNRRDYRIKMCTDVTMEDMITIHHEMGHIQYYLQYKDQPISFREGANPGFHEAVGDVMALSVSTPEHLHKIGLLDTLENDSETDLNFLMSMALDKIAFLPFGYLIDQWRWSVFSGETPKDKYNDKWWQLRCKYQGLSPPVSRSSDDFDPGAKYHIPANVAYIRYFVSFVIQFQFHQALCDAAGHKGPLHRCDIYKNKVAGEKLSSMLRAGSSIPWQDSMEAITGQRQMSAEALMEYFKPLTEWLKKQNKGQPKGWDEECPNPNLNRNITTAKQWLQSYNNLAENAYNTAYEAEWAYESNITTDTQKKMVEARLVFANFKKESSRNASSFDWKKFSGATRREFSEIVDIGTDSLTDVKKLRKMNELLSNISGIYGKGEVCLSTRGCLRLEPDLLRVVATSRNNSELLEAWEGWRKATGRQMKDQYEQFVKLSNEGVQELGYEDTGAYWRSWYESPTFQQDLENLLQQLKPFYTQLHGYVRNKLIEVYGEENFPDSGQIPAHLLGNMWGQTWNNIYDLVIPYEGKASVDITPRLQQQNYTPLRMFHTAENFFKSLNLSAMPDLFWKKTIMTKPKDGRDLVCHASAWDFYNKKDFRIKMCTAVTMEDLITIHHEMGHIQYYLQYKDQPVAFRKGANPGFHEAIGDTMALSVATPKHLHAIGLLPSAEADPESELNFLMSMALDKIAFLPFGYLIDQWRWSVFSGETPKDKYNEKWWQLRCKYQGISPPVKRSTIDFDPGAKYHIPGNTPYIRYFISNMIQFQFHKGLCQAAGYQGPIHHCDIYQSKEAGRKLGDMLKMGSSKPWPDAMEALTGQRNMSALPILEYFKPLIDWLQKQNAGKKVGWNEECMLPRRVVNPDLDAALQWLHQYNRRAEKEYYVESEVEWSYATNVTDENAQKQVEARLVLSKFEKEAAHNASQFQYQCFKSEKIKREFQQIRDIGTSALEDEDKLKKLNSLQSEIEGIYAKGKVCLTPERCLSLEPDLYRIMSTSRNYSELELVWKGWRDVTGKLMKEKYAKFVQISNQGVQELGYDDTGAYWRSWYESPSFKHDLIDLLEQLKPLYQKLHTYVRSQLKTLYGAQHFPKSGHIPAHLLGNMWAQEWQNLYDIMVPFKEKPSVDVTPTMKARNYTALKMFRTAEGFFVSLGLKPMPQAFWDKSMMIKPTGRDVVCHASAWDFYNQKDFRIKMCTDVTMEDMITIHHEMGHIQYYLQYKDQPISFREGANPGFHEAIGDTMALSATTPNHLHKIGLLSTVHSDSEVDINFLMKMALEKIAFLPFGYLIDQWRWSVFSGETPENKYNDKWWELRCKYQGVSPPVARSTMDFDPGAKYHIPSNTPYIRYFVSFVIQFQFHQALCDAAGHKGPLHQCDIYQSKEAGKLLSDMLKLGSSVPWPEAMRRMTGQRKMDVKPILAYFKPLTDWLEQANAGRSEGWSEKCPSPRTSTTSTNMKNHPVNINMARTFRVSYIVLALCLIATIITLRFYRDQHV